MALVALCLVAAALSDLKLRVADVAFVSKGDVWVGSANGSNLRQLTRDGQNESPSISPDGRRVAYLKDIWTSPRNERGGHLKIYDLATGRSRDVFGNRSRFAFLRQGYDNPTTPWSPDGKWIVCSDTNIISLSRGHHDSACNGAVWIVPTNGGKARRLVKAPAEAQRGRMPGFIWSPSGREILWWNTDQVADWFHIVDLRGNDRRLRFADIPAGGSLGEESPVISWRSPQRLVIGLNGPWPGFNRDASISLVNSSGERIWRSRNVELPVAMAHREDRAICLVRTSDDVMETWLTDLHARRIKRLERGKFDGRQHLANWSLDDSHIALFGYEKPVELFDEAGRDQGKIFDIPPHRGIDNVFWTRDGKSLWVTAPLQAGFNDHRIDDLPDLYCIDIGSRKGKLVSHEVGIWEVFVRR